MVYSLVPKEVQLYQVSAGFPECVIYTVLFIETLVIDLTAMSGSSGP